MTNKEKEDELTSHEKLILAAKRLERLLGGNSGTNSSTTAGSVNKAAEKKTVVEAATTMIHSNPCKIVKRWLGTSSGISAKVTLSDISLAAQTLLNPSGPSSSGRHILIRLSPPPTDDIKMKADDNDDTANTAATAAADKETYLDASARELEAYLFSLAIRTLWSQGQSSMQQAFELCIKAIQIVTIHIEEAEANPHTPNNGTNPGVGTAATSGLFPLLARLYRYQGLVSESVDDAFMTQVAGREQLVHAHRMSVMRRDIDTQSTLLNLMLRELLLTDQGEFCESNNTYMYTISATLNGFTKGMSLFSFFA